MKQYGALLIIVAVVVAIGAIVHFLPAKVIIVERDSRVTVYDTVRIIATPEGRAFRARSIELNRADSAALVSVYGVGAVFQQRIIEYRKKLGGFYRKEQLREVKGITEEVYNKIQANFWVDTLGITKIKLNFAPSRQLKEHPYTSPSMVRRLLKAVESKGGYYTLGQLLNENILLPDEAHRMSPYLSFDRNNN